jgi:hypothetical protein
MALSYSISQTLGFASAPGGVVSLVNIARLGCDSCNAGLVIPAGVDGVTLSIGDLYVHGSGAGSTKVSITGNNAQVGIGSLDTQLAPNGIVVGVPAMT